MPSDAPGAESRPHKLLWRFYSSGGRPIARNELDALDVDGKAAVVDLVKRFRVGEHMPGELKKLTGTKRLFELIASVSGREYRVIFFKDTSVVCVGVKCFEKKSRRTPKRHIQTAQDRMNEWQGVGAARAKERKRKRRRR